MKPIIATVCLAGLLAGFTPLQAAEKAEDDFSRGLFPPELIFNYQFEIKLTDDQREFLTGEVKKLDTVFKDRHEALQGQMKTMQGLLAKDKVDQEKALAQLDAVLDYEKAIKRLHMEMLIKLKNNLTAEQIAQLKEFKAKALRDPRVLANAYAKRLPAKMKKVKAGVDRWISEGRDPSGIGQIMEEFEPLMDLGRHAEAEEVLDKALKALKAEE